MDTIVIVIFECCVKFEFFFKIDSCLLFFE